jgi:hypothetical protein
VLCTLLAVEADEAEVLMKHSRMFSRAPRIPFFPLIPIVPMAIFVAESIATVALYRKVRRLQAR